MLSSGKKKILASAFAACTILGTSGAVLAVSSGAGASVKPGTKIKGSSNDVQFQGTINGVQITVTCTSFKDTATVTSGANKTLDIPAPKITGCTDTLGGTDTIKTNSTNGKWELTTTNGSTLTLVIPKAGAVFSSNVLSSCKITAAPTKAAKVTGTYSSSSGTDTVTGANIPVKGSGCTATKSSITSTVTFTPNPGTIPPFAS